MAKAKDRSDQFGQQSQHISSISRDARMQAERLEAQAEANKQSAIAANENSLKAYEMAKNTITLQKNIRLVLKFFLWCCSRHIKISFSHSTELRNNIGAEIAQSKEKLEATARLTNESLRAAEEMYNNALTLFANVNALKAPQINVDKLKQDAALANQQAQRLQTEIAALAAEHEKLLIEYDENSELGEVLVRRSNSQQEEAIQLLEHVKTMHTTAQEAVALGDGTLKEANNTYNTLAGLLHFAISQI